jgi:hypothetical protein
VGKSNCHEKRFDPYNYFPENLSDNKPVRKVDFNLIRARDNLCYRDTRCSEQLYEHKKHLNLFHKKDIGILQFGRSNLQRDDDEKRMAKLKEYSRPSDNLLSDILSGGDLNPGNGGK